MARIRTHNNRRRAKAEKARMAGDGFWRIGLIQSSIIRVGPPGQTLRWGDPDTDIEADMRDFVERYIR